MIPEPDAGFILPVDKPEGPTSHDVVAIARRALGIRRIGHTGTLDPFASGLLLLCVGNATRLAEYLGDLPKTYNARIRLGITTDSDDRTGSILSSSDDWQMLARQTIERALTGQVGEILQTPPAFSAKKIDGERAYRLARRGEAVTIRPARVRVDSAELKHLLLPDLDVEITCGAGTYIRSIARDIGTELKCGAHLVALRRTRIGPHAVNDAVPVDHLGGGNRVELARVDPVAALSHLDTLDVDNDEARAIAHGRAISTGRQAPGPVVLVHEGRVLAIGEAAGGQVRPRKVFA
jgi:tRNA pseudouridine55 synthase